MQRTKCKLCDKELKLEQIECCAYCTRKIGPLDKKCRTCGRRKGRVMRRVWPHAAKRYHEECKILIRRQQKLANWHRNKEHYR